MASLRVRNGKLLMEFRYNGIRCRELTALSDTPRNRKRIEKVLNDITVDIKLGRFVYSDYFPQGAQRFRLENLDNATREYIEQLNAHLPKFEEVPHFEEFAWEWFSENQIRWKTSHEKNIKLILETYLIPEFGRSKVHEISRPAIIKYRASLGKRRAAHDKDTVSNDWINHVMTPLRGIMTEAAVRFDFANPYEDIPPLKIERAEIHPLSLEEVQRFLHHVPEPFHDYYVVRFFTGMRTAEIDGLQWRFVDFERRQIVIHETLVNGKTETPKTRASYRAIHMSQPVFDAMQRQYQRTRHFDYVFCNEVGNALDHRNINKRIWKPTLERANIPYRRPYESRHTAATLWLAAGESPEWISRQLGHSTTKMLFEVYSRYVPNLTRQDGSAFESLLAKKGMI